MNEIVCAIICAAFFTICIFAFWIDDWLEKKDLIKAGWTLEELKERYRR